MMVAKLSALLPLRQGESVANYIRMLISSNSLIPPIFKFRKIKISCNLAIESYQRQEKRLTTLKRRNIVIGTQNTSRHIKVCFLGLVNGRTRLHLCS